MDINEIKKRKITIDGKEFTLSDLADTDDAIKTLNDKISLKQKLDSEGSGEPDTMLYGEYFAPKPKAKGTK